jgi:hypothetical protein
MRLGFAVVLTALVLAPGAARAETARGTVFEDLDADGVRDPGEPGIPHVRVSDGRQVILTDDAGRYTLEIDNEAVVFVTKPRGYATPVNGHMLPQFYYIHQPAGSPEGLRYPGIAPTGPLPAAIDFPLRRREEPPSFEAILLSDPQPQSQAEVGFIADDVVSELIGTRARFGMTMGDILFDDLSLFPRYNSVIARIGIPWYNVPGNHEMNLLATDDRYALETFKRHYGPPYYAFEYADAVFFVLDNIDYEGSGEIDPGDLRGTGGYVARITDDQLAWLEAELAHVPEDRLVFLAMHSPLETYLSDAPGVNTQNRRELFRLLSGRRHLYAVAGHTHSTEHHYFDDEDGFDGPEPFHHHVLTTVSGSWWSGPLDERGVPVSEQRDGTPNGYHVLEVDGVEVKVRYKAAGKPADYQMRIVFDVAHHGTGPNLFRDFRPGELLDGRLTVDEVPAADVYVNLFDGGPRSKVEVSVGERTPIPMTRASRVDPSTAELLLRNPDTVKSWVEAQPSSHLFVADLPDDLGPGTYTVTARAVDEFGRVHHAHRVLEVLGSSAAPAATVVYPD